LFSLYVNKYILTFNKRWQ